MIKKSGNKWILYFSDGRKEEFNSEEAANKREKQINYFKYMKQKGIPKKK